MTATEQRSLIAALTALIAAIITAVTGKHLAGANLSQIGSGAAAAITGGLAVHHAPKIKRKVKKRRAPPPYTMPRFGLDWAWGTISPKALRTVGASFACRYLSHDPTKDLSPGEARRLLKAGIHIVTVWESTGNRALEGHPAGVEDARAALAQLRNCFPSRAWVGAVYFAIDFDATGFDVGGYFTGARSVLQPAGVAVGAYGGIRPLRHLLDQSLITHAWQTYAWSAGEWEPRAQLLQISNGHTVAGVSCDFDRAVKPDFGYWRA